jgi:phenylpropionate dioxygenase-like ring-hydroxylating dioxygenase large terminal subunit
MQGDATMHDLAGLADDATVVQRILDHIDGKTTDLAASGWREPVESYRSAARFAAELRVLRRRFVPFCPSAALVETGAYVARSAAGVPLLAVRGGDGAVRAFRNACRHRGMQLAAGSGCARSFSCTYHGWTYGLDGSLRHVPHEHGFPELDKHGHGLVPVACAERSGLVLIAQDLPAGSAPPDLPALLEPRWTLRSATELDVLANWKVFTESFLEGYHIRSTHPRTFYPIQYDNLNVIESFGPNSRIAFPYQAIEKLRGAPAAERSAHGRLTYVYHLFPNVIVATFPTQIVIAVLEPVAVDRTRLVTYVLGDPAVPDPGAREGALRGRALVDAGAAEDRAVVEAIQRGIASGANEHFEFGRFEGAIAHFHRTLRAALGEDAGGATQ